MIKIVAQPFDLHALPLSFLNGSFASPIKVKRTTSSIKNN
jgi:hypothetical protein